MAGILLPSKVLSNRNVVSLRGKYHGHWPVNLDVSQKARGSLPYIEDMTKRDSEAVSQDV